MENRIKLELATTLLCSPFSVWLHFRKQYQFDCIKTWLAMRTKSTSRMQIFDLDVLTLFADIDFHFDSIICTLSIAPLNLDAHQFWRKKIWFEIGKFRSKFCWLFFRTNIFFVQENVEIILKVPKCTIYLNILSIQHTTATLLLNGSTH